MNNKSIAVFDTGVGGLTVLKELKKELPNENYIYLGDTARVPYGPRPKNQVIEFTLNIIDFLKRQDIKAIVIACNTITSVAIEAVRNVVDVPVIGVIEPGVKMALSETKSGNIGIIATEGTIKSNVYQKKILESLEGNEALGVACPEFVTIAEKGTDVIGEDRVKETTQAYLDEFDDFYMDALILGCTHFPVLEPYIKNILGPNIKIINPAYETAIETKKTLKNNKILNNGNGKTEYFVTKDKDYFKRVGERILESTIDNIEEINL